ncbi:hypothetical protein CHLRE_02g141166v5 [Chlamydomonas reinhardtii]|uniref:Uncharacterized protein n=1 Tax=Chlamydomonas reinhardtii TaxID=3055 RepID=A0A2K3E488_CHLRE|nr:uncharacterized protein CHLRE_02g141166v5 [Chlamydomonas reinhardtii]PNW87586.1 hypothetical protein CHLRE_02g141166v5 [Chlamydomonas reinhardtii]
MVKDKKLTIYSKEGLNNHIQSKLANIDVDLGQITLKPTFRGRETTFSALGMPISSNSFELVGPPASIAYLDHNKATWLGPLALLDTTSGATVTMGVPATEVINVVPNTPIHEAPNPNNCNDLVEVLFYGDVNEGLTALRGPGQAIDAFKKAMSHHLMSDLRPDLPNDTIVGDLDRKLCEPISIVLGGKVQTKELTEDQRNYANSHGASNHKNIISVAYETTAQRDYVREGGMWLFEIPTQRSSFCIVFMPLATKWAPGVLEQLSTTVFYRTVRQNGSLPRVTQDEIIHIGKQLLQRYTTIDSKMLEMAEEYANTNGQPFDEATANRACLADIMGNTSPFNAIPDNELQYYTFVMTNGAWQPLALLQSETERYYVVEALTVAPANNMSHLTHLGAARPHRWLSRFRDFADPANHHLKFARALALPADKWELDAILPARSGLCREDKWLSGRYPNMDGPNYEHPEAHTYLMAAVASSTRPPERLLQVAEFCLTGNQLPTVAGNNTRERNAVKPNLLVAGYRMATMPQMALTQPAAAPANIIDEDEEGSD